MTGSDFLTQEEYYQNLFSLEYELADKDWISRTKIWNRKYLRLSDPPSLADLPLALALVHPDWWVDWRGKSIRPSEDGWPKAELLKCDFEVISGNPCAWNQNKRLQGTLHHDHRWPKSLGGPEDGYNLLPLCGNHNRAKGNGLWGFHWDFVPQWLEPRLKNIRKQKLLGIDPNQI